jgi:hypothetical protein
VNFATKFQKAANILIFQQSRDDVKLMDKLFLILIVKWSKYFAEPTQGCWDIRKDEHIFQECRPKAIPREFYYPERGSMSYAEDY